jgi:hypothetical protein
MLVIPIVYLHCFLTIPKAPIKSNRKMSAKQPLIDYSKIIIMTNEHFVVARC